MSLYRFQLPTLSKCTPVLLLALCLPPIALAQDNPPAQKIDTSDWDWGSFDAMDDTPVSPNETRRQPRQVSSSRLSIDEVTEPDLEAEPRPAYELFQGMPQFAVIASRKDGEMHPCASCHEWVTSNPSPRKLDAPHDNFQLQHGLHGKGQFWCFSCHDSKGSGSLKTLEGEKLAFEDAYILCSQCHVDQARDWAFGAHGKRRGNWRGERQVYNCTVCHYQHSPAFKPRQAMPGPEIRVGLQRPAHWVPKQGSTVLHGHKKIWGKTHE